MYILFYLTPIAYSSQNELVSALLREALHLRQLLLAQRLLVVAQGARQQGAEGVPREALRRPHGVGAQGGGGGREGHGVRAGVPDHGQGREGHLATSAR